MVSSKVSSVAMDSDVAESDSDDDDARGML